MIMDKDMDLVMPKERGVNFTRKEMDLFQKLIDRHRQVLFNKKTDTATNCMKNSTWAAIHAEFNKLVDQPRTVQQLKHKFDNMKRIAKKESQTMTKDGHDNRVHNNEEKEMVHVEILSNSNTSDEYDMFHKIYAAPLHKEPKTKPLRNKQSNRQKLRFLKKIKMHEEHIYQVRLKHMEEKRNEEREIYELKKKKLLLQISLLENKNE